MQYVPDTSEQALIANEVVVSGHLILTVLKKSQYLKKVHIVQMVQKQKQKKRTDRLEQIDTLTFSDETAKLVDFAEYQGNWYVFMLSTISLKKGDNKIRVFTVKITPRPIEDEGSNDAGE
jgi:hypothetical protein